VLRSDRRIRGEDVGSRAANGSRRGLASRPRTPAVAPSSAFALRSQPGAPKDTRGSDLEHVSVLKQFELASRYFHKQQYAKAKEIFERLASAPYLEVADRARLHSHLCDQKLERPASLPRRVDHYLLGVAELNVRNVDLAIEHLTKADKSAPNREYIRYALAAAHAVRGNADLALEHLKAAVRLRPQNSIQARHDQDFRSLAERPDFRNLIGAEASRSAPATA
jgi:tetratricopeptide (TPR) repeat protein